MVEARNTIDREELAAAARAYTEVTVWHKELNDKKIVMNNSWVPPHPYLNPAVPGLPGSLTTMEIIIR